MPLPVHKHRKTHTHTQTLNSHALSGIRTHGPGFRASEDSARLRSLGYRDRRSGSTFLQNLDTHLPGYKTILLPTKPQYKDKSLWKSHIIHNRRLFMHWQWGYMKLCSVYCPPIYKIVEKILCRLLWVMHRVKTINHSDFMRNLLPSSNIYSTSAAFTTSLSCDTAPRSSTLKTVRRE
jgi:hypothetical protein